MTKQEVVDKLRESGLAAELKDHIPFLTSTDPGERERFTSILGELGYCSSYGYSLDDGECMSIRETGVSAAG